MAAIPTAKRKTQLALFNEQPIMPHWDDLAPQIRVEAVSLLAQLLVSTQTGSRAPQERGGRDE